MTPPPPTTPDDPDAVGTVVDIDVADEMRESFLEYAYSVIYSRALPDARDGLKPVHRRILFQMSEMGLRPDRGHVKSARVVGDVMGKLHPHGDTAIYDALVRMAQPFSMRVPMVDGHGNFGSLDDGPAAYRYCVTGDTRVRVWDGSSRRIDDVVGLSAPGERAMNLPVLDKDGKLVMATAGFHSGVHPTRTMITESGHRLQGTDNHPVLGLVQVLGVPMFQWLRLDEVTPGTVVCLARNVWAEVVPTAREYELGVLLGAWVSEGFASEGRAGFNNTDQRFFDEVLSAYDRVVGGPRYVYSRHTRRDRKRIHELDIQNLSALRESPLGALIGSKARDKHVPETVWAGSVGVKRAFLMSLFEGDGGVRRASDDSITVQYSTYSPRLAREVQELLLEFGVHATWKRYRTSEEQRLIVSGRTNIAAFSQRVGFMQTKQNTLRNALADVPAHTHRLTRDFVPYVADYVRDSCPPGRGSGKTWLLQHNFDRVDRWQQNRRLLLGRFKDDEVLRTITPIMDSGYRFVRVASVEESGPAAVYSLRVDSDDHSFLAGGFVNHNTECRLAPAAELMTGSLDEDVVDLVPNYDDQGVEPAVLPAAFPNLLVNGTTGIAVGMATNMAPHNLGEVVAATRHLIDHPDATLADLMRFVPGPDLPTGGVITGLDGVREAYETGRGAFRTRARVEVTEVTARRRGLVVSELPYTVGPEKVIAKIKELVLAKKLAGIADVKDLTDRHHGLRLVIEVKNGFNPDAVLAELYRLTPMEDSFSINAVCLVDGQPRTLGLKELLEVYLGHRYEVVRRRSEYRRRKALERAHIVEGMLLALANIDEVVQVIRSSQTTEEARTRLIEVFELSEIQAGYILDMPLRRLVALEVEKLQRELAELQATIAGLDRILGSETVLRRLVSDELAEVSKAFATPRRTVLLEGSGAPTKSSVPLEVADTACRVLLSSAGRLARTTSDELAPFDGERAEHDLVVASVTTTARATIGAVTDTGRLVKVDVLELPTLPPTASAPSLRGGAPAVELVDLAAGERVVGLVSLREDGPGLALGTRAGVVKRVRPEYPAAKDSFEVVTLSPGDAVVACLELTSDAVDLVFVTTDAQLLHFPAGDVRAQGRAGGGIAGVKVAADASVLWFGAVDPTDPDVVVATVAGDSAAMAGQQATSAKVSAFEEFPGKGRATGGVRSHRFLRGEDVLVAAWAGPGPALAASTSGAPVTLSRQLGRRDGSGTPLAGAVASVAGAVGGSGAASPALAPVGESAPAPAEDEGPQQETLL